MHREGTCNGSPFLFIQQILLEGLLCVSHVPGQNRKSPYNSVEKVKCGVCQKAISASEKDKAGKDRVSG